MTDVTRILKRIESGEGQATDELLTVVYNQLRRLASHRLAREAPGQTLQTTELVHEAYLRLVGSDTPWKGKEHFFAAAAEAMRRILVERARKKGRIKHGGGLERLALSDSALAVGEPPEEVLIVDDFLDLFAETHPVEAQVVKLHFFAGLNISEAARALDIPTTTAHRYWTFARAWMVREIRKSDERP